MCGFAGVVAWDGRYQINRPALARMAAAVAHRGPDGEGFYENHGGAASPGRPHAALAFRRLAVLDPDPRSDQPFTIGRKTVVFNGEIYNFRELRAELSRDFPAYEWRTAGDTEVLLRGYDCWGERCVEKFNGMFAFAVWDDAEQTLFLARDRMGQKPLYVAAVDSAGRPCWPTVPPRPFDPPIKSPAVCDSPVLGSRADLPVAVAFASEPAALMPVPWVDATPDRAALSDYLRWGYTLDRTVYRGVRNARPGRWMRVGAGAAAQKQYFDLVGLDRRAFGSPATLPHGGAVAQTRRRVTQAIVRRLVSDVPLGCLLSGGIDSSIIASAMRREGPVQTFSVGFDDPRYDESEHAAAVARHLGTEHHRFTVRPDAADDLPKLAAAFGEPFADSSALPTHYLARETRKHVTVALGGDGGDELFGGYDRYRAMRMHATLGPLLTPARAAGLDRLLGRLGGAGAKSRRSRLARLIRTHRGDAGERYAQIMQIFDEPTIRSLWRNPPRRDPEDGEALDMAGFCITQFPRPPFDGRRHAGSCAVEGALAADRATYLPGDLLTKVDRASMLHALEVRSPFMDPDVVTFAAGLTADQLLKGGPKRMLREAFAADLPAWVFTRRKMGFAVPVSEWFRSSLRDMLRGHLFAAESFAASHFDLTVVRRLVEDHESGRADHGQRLYALLMLELWWSGRGA